MLDRKVFDEGAGRLCGYFRPSRWSDAIQEEYWNAIYRWNGEEWRAVVEKAILVHKTMPKIADLNQVRRVLHRKWGQQAPEACQECAEGYIYLLVERADDYPREIICACTCSRGETKYNLMRWPDAREKWQIRTVPQRGWTYTADEFKEAIQRNNVRLAQSVSAPEKDTELWETLRKSLKGG